MLRREEVQRRSSCQIHMLLMCSRTPSTPSGDSQKRPSRNSGKGFLQWKIGWLC